MKLKRFLINSALLTAASVITQALCMIFRIYMSNTIGAEAIGLYQLIVTVYVFAVTAVTSGITLLVTRLVTEATALGNLDKVKSIVKKCTSVALVTSLLVASVLYFGSDFFADRVLKQSVADISLRALAPSLPFIAISACARGYFFAMRQAVVTAGEQLIEQIIEMAVFSILVGAMAPKGIEYACCAVAIGATLSEVLTAVYSMVMYLISTKKLPKSSKSFVVGKHLIFIALPVSLSACLRSGLSVIEHSTIPTGLIKYGYDKHTALEDYGMVTGMVMPLLAFPSVVMFSVASMIIPELSEVYARSDHKQIQRIASNMVKLVLLFSIPIAVVFSFFGNELGVLIYKNETVGKYICVFSLLVPVIYMDSIVDGMLKGLNEQLHYLTYNIADSFIRVILVILLIPKYGIVGFVIVMYTGAVFNTGLSLLRLIKVADIKIKVLSWVLAPLGITVILCMIVKLAMNYI
ncbi:MAG: oligosaccharide flippase family protein [Acutalibacteraceae bacterium]|nr:oligosaccharide flippase family protein [Acutalibacteraceae bacterium]